MTRSACIGDLTPFRISGPVIATVPPGRDPQPVSGQVWLRARPRVITGWRQEASRPRRRRICLPESSDGWRHPGVQRVMTHHTLS